MRSKIIICLLACVSGVAACGDDDSSGLMEIPDTGQSDEQDANVSGDAATAGSGGTAGMDYTPPPEPPACTPNPYPSGSCMKCALDICCAECGATRCTADDFVECVEDCVASPPEDAAVSENFVDQLVACGEACGLAFDYRQRDLLACLGGTARPIFVNGDGGANFIEGEEEDGGSADSCRAECFPIWE